MLWAAHFLAVDAFVALLLAAGLTLWIAGADTSHQQIDGLLDSNRSNIYRAVATIAGTMIGFAITVASIITTTTSSERFRLLRRSPHYHQLWKTYIQTIKCFGLVAILALAALVADRDSSPMPWILVPLMFFCLLSAFRFARCVWILELIIQVVSSPLPNERRLGPPQH